MPAYWSNNTVDYMIGYQFFPTVVPLLLPPQLDFAEPGQKG